MKLPPQVAQWRAARVAARRRRRRDRLRDRSQGGDSGDDQQQERLRQHQEHLRLQQEQQRQQEEERLQQQERRGHISSLSNMLNPFITCFVSPVLFILRKVEVSTAM